MKKTKKLAFSGIMVALCVVILFLGSFFSTIDLTLAGFAGMILILAVIEMGDKWAWCIFAAASILSWLLIPSKTVVCFFVCFMGWYPIAKRTFERLHPFLAWCVKISAFNVFLTIMILILKFVLRLPSTDLDFGYALYGVANATFIVYDIALSKIILFYIIKLRKILGLNKLL